MSRITVQRTIAPFAAALLIAVTVAPVPGHGAAPDADRDRSARLATIALETRGQAAQLYDVNRFGLVLGALTDDAGATQPVLWRDYRNPVPIDLPPGHSIRMNARGHIAGVGLDEMDLASWLWRPSGVTELRWPERLVWMTDLNDRDQIVGSVEHPAGDLPRQPFRWQDGQFTMLPVPAGMHGQAAHVNNRGDVLGSLVGFQDLSDRRSVLWRAGRMTELHIPGSTVIYPFDLNNRGQVVGAYVQAGTDLLRPFLWEDGRFVDLLRHRPEARGSATDINDAGEIVGFAADRAVLWRDGRMIDIGVEGNASRINERGDVAGVSYTSVSPLDWAVRAYLWRDGRLYYSAPVVGPEANGSVRTVDDRGRIFGGLRNPGGDGGCLCVWVPTHR